MTMTSARPEVTMKEVRCKNLVVRRGRLVECHRLALRVTPAMLAEFDQNVELKCANCGEPVSWTIDEDSREE